MDKQPIRIGKYLSVSLLPRGRGRKTDRWEVFNHVQDPKCDDDPLADINWYPRWRQYVFDPHLGTVWNGRCLIDIAEFLKAEMEKRKKGAAPTGETVTGA